MIVREPLPYIRFGSARFAITACTHPCLRSWRGIENGSFQSKVDFV